MTLENGIKPKCTIEDLPDEVLEFILDLIPPYKDLHDCLMVSKRWRRCVLNVTKIKQRNLTKAIMEFDITWQSLIPVAMTPTITKRYSHAAAVHENSMYVFGGCTCSMTTFNDLWRLDLSKRQWVRPLTMGTSYPSPKACCTMVCYENCLVLFGGWTHPASYPLHQTWHLFNELHVYDIIANNWNCINTENTPPPTAGHSVSVHGKWMVIFGGLQRASNVVHSTKSNDIWKLNLETWEWFKQEVEGPVKPMARYGQSQTLLDHENILMMGGTGGTAVYYSDVWVLKMTGELWKWVPVEVRNTADAPPNLWCNPACKIGDKIVVLSRSRQNNTPPLMYYSKGVWVPPRGNPEHEKRLNGKSKQVDRDENVNGKRGSFSNHRRQNGAEESQPGPSHVSPSNSFRDRPVSNVPNNVPAPGISLSAFNPTENKTPRVDHRRERRLENLRRIEEKLKKQVKETQEICVVPSPKKQKRNVLGMYVLDISHALDEKPYVTWLPLKNNGAFTEGPEETILYSLVAGKSELIMFGGIQKEESSLACTTNLLSNQVTNSLHIITAPKYII